MLLAIVVNESGASVYSASSVAREEFPDYDVTVSRVAFLSAGRLMDPLAEIGEDRSPNPLAWDNINTNSIKPLCKKSLEDVVVSCVKLGWRRPEYFQQGIAHTCVGRWDRFLAKNIIDTRNKNGAFASRNDLKKSSPLWRKSFRTGCRFPSHSECRKSFGRQCRSSRKLWNSRPHGKISKLQHRSN